MTTSNPNISNYYNEALLSDLAYEKDPNRDPLAVGGVFEDIFSGNKYEVLSISNTSSDYQGYAFKNIATGEVTIAHRGTQEAKDWFADGAIGIDQIPTQVQDAIAFNQQVIDQLSEDSQSTIDSSTIKQTGHSLGGGIAQIIAATNNSSAVTFNAPIVGHLLNDLNNSYPSGEFSNINFEDLRNNVIEIRESDDIVSTIPPYADHIGSVITVEAPNPTDIFGNAITSSLDGAFGAIAIVIDALTAHAMGYMLDLVKSQAIDEELSQEIIDQYSDDVMSLLKVALEEELQQSLTDESFQNIIGNLNTNIAQDITNADYNSSYTIQQGDTLSSIADLYGTTIDALIAANPWLTDEGRISDDGAFALIKPDENLSLPDGAEINSDSELYNYLLAIGNPANLINDSVFADIIGLLGQVDVTLILENIGLIENVFRGTSDEDDFSDGDGVRDLIYGYGGDDIIYGGRGDDSLNGSGGSDTYVFNFGDGFDTIYDNEGSSSDINTLQFGEGISFENLIFTLDQTNTVEDNLSITFSNNADDKILIDKQDDALYDIKAINLLKFADGSVYDITDPNSLTYTYYGTGEDDSFRKYNTSDYNDVIHMNQGDDYVDAGRGDDELYGEQGDDELYGSSGNDKIEGGLDDDYLSGGSGNDTYIFNLGDGKDTIRESGGISSNESYGYDTIKLGAEISKEDVYFSISGRSLYINFYNNDSDQIIVSGQYVNNVQSLHVEELEFYNGDIINVADTNTMVFKEYGSEVGETITGTDYNDVIYGYGGNDTIDAGRGNDTIIAGAGDDYIGKNSSTYRNYGDDTYVFNVGDGSDIISEAYRYYNGDLGNDTIKLGPGIIKDDVYFTQQGSHLVIKFKHSDKDQITINRHMNSISNRVENLEFSDGETVDLTDFDNMTFHFYGTENSDTIVGSAYEDIIYGYGGGDTIGSSAGNDTIIGSSGNDTIDSGSGNDTITAGKGDDYIGKISSTYWNKGDDTYIFNKGDGSDIISEAYRYYNGDLGNDTIKLGEGISRDDVYFTKQGSHLVIKFKHSDQDQITIKNHINILANRVENLEFFDGSFVDLSDLSNLPFYVGGTESSEIIDGSSSNDAIYGYKGDDVISAGDGDDILIGGQGSDTMDGGNGIDRVSYFDSEEGVTIDLSNGEVSGGDAQGDILLNVENITGSNHNDFLHGDDNNNEINGGEGNDVLDGGSGDDILSGGLGDDTFIINANDASAERFSITNDSGNMTTIITDFDVSNINEAIEIKDFADIREFDDLEIAYNDNANGSYDAHITLPNSQEINVNNVVQNSLTANNFNFRPLNAAPIAEEDNISLNEDNALVIDIDLDLLSNDTDNEDIIPSFNAITTNPVNGVLVDNGNGTLIYTPNSNYFGTDSFVYEVIDSSGELSSATVNITIDSVNDVPVISNPISNKTAQENSLFSYVIPSDVFSDADGDNLTLNITQADGSALPSWLTFDSATNTLSGTPIDVISDNSLSLTITATDPDNASISQNFNINILNTIPTDQIIKGTNGRDILTGADGDDIIRGNGGHDILNGEAGDDTLSGNQGRDILNGGEGNDILKGGRGQDELNGGQGDDFLVGHRGKDILRGDDGDDVLKGGRGSDELYGGNDNDILIGQRGSDILSGGAGKDILFGGRGRDIFVFNEISDSLNGLSDVIRDFQQNRDVIDLSNLEFTNITNDQSQNDDSILTYRHTSTQTIIESENQEFQIEMNGIFDLGVGDFDFG